MRKFFGETSEPIVLARSSQKTHTPELHPSATRTCVPSTPIDPALVKLTGVLDKFKNGHLKSLTVREF
eukprot:COSAG02_NODE_68609_length_234_cov_6.096296_1_plen_67_part_01